MRRIRRRPAILQHAVKRLDHGIRPAEAAVVMVEHGMPTPVLRIFQFLKDRLIECGCRAYGLGVHTPLGGNRPCIFAVIAVQEQHPVSASKGAAGSLHSHPQLSGLFGEAPHWR